MTFLNAQSAEDAELNCHVLHRSPRSPRTPRFQTLRFQTLVFFLRPYRDVACSRETLVARCLSPFFNALLCLLSR